MLAGLITPRLRSPASIVARHAITLIVRLGTEYTISTVGRRLGLLYIQYCTNAGTLQSTFERNGSIRKKKMSHFVVVLKLYYFITHKHLNLNIEIYLENCTMVFRPDIYFWSDDGELVVRIRINICSKPIRGWGKAETNPRRDRSCEHCRESRNFPNCVH